MKAFFSPRSIAVAGASDSEHKIGHRVLQRILANFKGRLYAIHPSATQVLGVPAYSDPCALPESVDLLIALLPGDRLLPLIERFRTGQAKYLLAIPSGFGEASPEGKTLERAIVCAANDKGMRVVGPNCMGMFNGPHGLNASLVPDMPPAGPGLSCLTQSGGYGIAVSMYALDHALPVAKICDLGNTSDVQITEMLRYFKDDRDTRVLGLFLEAVGETHAFAEAVAEVGLSKPVVLTQLGRTAAGQRASFAHLGLESTPSIKGTREGTAWIPAQTGVELLHTAKALCWQPRPRGRRAAIVTATGGIGAELADLALEHGLEVPPLSAGVREAMASLLPSFAALRNPIDLTPIYWQFASAYPAIMRILLESDEVDLLMICITDVGTAIDELAPAIIEAVREHGARNAAGKPVYVYWGARDDMLANQRVLEAGKVPCYRTTLEVVRTAALIADHAQAGGASPSA